MTTLEDLGYIRVGPYRISAEWMTDDDREKYGEPAGYYVGEECRIGLREDLDVDFVKETLLHEVLHACLTAAGQDPYDDTEERVLRALAPTLLDTLQRNPKLVRYLRQR